MFAACGGTGDGAVLSFTAPDGPVAASRIEVVLASADSGSMIATRQRIRPGILMQEDVVYYRQRSRVDAIQDIVALDGFELRIEPDPTVVGDETFVPFALIYDKQDVLIGVGTVNADDGTPIPVLVRPGTVASYEMTVVQLAPDADRAGITAGQGHAVLCESQTGSWRSGAVWRPASGPQIRLLLPDVSADPDAMDAMERASDLDCDDHAVDKEDCDDLRAAYYPGQIETCDGDDTDCDNRRLELVEGCSPLNGENCSAPGVSLCAEGPLDNSSGLQGTCKPSAACGCAQTGGGIPQGCVACALKAVGANSSGNVAPCAPAVGKVHFDSCAAPGCGVDVVGADGPWELKIAAEESGPFSGRLTGITTGYFYLRATYLGTASFPPTSTTIGGAYTAITPVQGPPVLLPINLEIQDLALSTCMASPTTGNHAMLCSP